MLGCDDSTCVMRRCACAYAHVRTPKEELLERVAIALNWTWREVVSFSFPELREVLTVDHPKLAAEMTEWIQSGRVVREE